MARKGGRLSLRFPRGDTFGRRIANLEAQMKSAAGMTSAEVASSLGVSPSTLRRWKDRTDKPATVRGNLSDKITRRERYYYHERPRRVAPPPAEERTRLSRVTPADLDELVGRKRPDQANLLERPLFAFDLRPSELFADAIRSEATITFTINYQGDPFEGPAGVNRTITLPTAGLDPSYIDSFFFRAVRDILNEIVDETDDSDVSVALIGATAA